MATSSASIGIGTTLAYASGLSGTSFTTLGELTDVKMPEVNVAKAEATHYLSGSNTAEFIPIPWKEYSDVDFELNYVKANCVIVNGLVGQANAYRITLPDGGVYNFGAFVSKFGGETPNKGKISQKGSLTIMGAVTFA